MHVACLRRAAVIARPGYHQAVLARVTPFLLALLVAVTVITATPGRVGAQAVEVHPALLPAWQTLVTLRTADG